MPSALTVIRKKQSTHSKTLVILALSCWISCSDDANTVEGSQAQPTPSIAMPSPTETVSEPNPATPEEALAALDEAIEALEEVLEVPAEVPEHDAILFGDIYMIEGADENGDNDESTVYTLLAKVAPQPRPRAVPVGRVAVHGGHWQIRVVRELSSPFEHVSVIDSGEVCEASVVRARMLHAQEAPHAHSEGFPQSWTFLGLEFAGCSGGSLGVAGAPVVVHNLRRDQMQLPASPDLVSLVRTKDDDLGWEAPVPAADFRMLRFPRRGISVVAGSAAWVVRDGEVLEERFHGFPSLLIEAGARTFFAMSAPSEDWAASLDDFLPPSASCVVVDASGSPLNVRGSPRSSGAVIDTLENDTRLRVVETRGGWRRVEGRGQAWVHESGLRCGQPG